MCEYITIEDDETIYSIRCTQRILTENERHGWNHTLYLNVLDVK